MVGGCYVGLGGAREHREAEALEVDDRHLVVEVALRGDGARGQTEPECGLREEGEGIGRVRFEWGWSEVWEE